MVIVPKMYTFAHIINRALEICNSDGSLMAFVCNAMPQRLKDALVDRLTTCLTSENTFKPRDSQDGKAYQCLHFSWYNRYTTNVGHTQMSLIFAS